MCNVLIFKTLTLKLKKAIGNLEFIEAKQPVSQILVLAGSVAGFITKPMKAIVTCGGYSLRNKTYVDFCQKFVEDGQPWKSAPSLNGPRAFASTFTIAGGLPTDGLYIAGGYNADDGFLDSGKLICDRFYDPHRGG